MTEKKKTQKEVLEEVKMILDRPKGWTQHALHRTDEKGKDAFCLLGAIEEATGYRELRNTPAIYNPGTPQVEKYREARDLRNTLVRRVGRGIKRCFPKDLDKHHRQPNNVITFFNDKSSRRKKDVLKAIDCAIEGR